MTLKMAHWEASQLDEYLDVSVGGLLRAAASDSPDAIALVDGGAPVEERRRWTFAELELDARRAAAEFQDHFEPGERVAIWAPNVPEWELLQLGAALAGLTVVTINPGYTARELRHALSTARASGLVFQEQVRGADQTAKLEQVRADCPSIRHAVPLASWPFEREPADPAHLPEVGADDPAMILYTSGTTGFPKGAVLSHAGLINNSNVFAQRYGLGPGSVWLMPLPMFNMVGCSFGALGAMARRAALVISEAEPGLILRLIEEERVNFSPVVPVIVQALLDHENFSATDLSSLQVLAAGGTPIPPAVVHIIEQDFGAEYGAIYGQTECGGVICQSYLSDSTFQKTERVGQALEGTSVKIVDLESRELLAVGEPGEVCIKSPFTMLGYFDDPEKTAETLDAEGWVQTGDLGTMDELGFVQLTGRLKDLIIRGAQNISAREIEDELFTHQDVSQAAVLGLPDDRYGEEVAAFVVPKDASVGVDGFALRAWLQERLAKYKLPRYWIAVDEIPMTPSGKVQKFALKDAYLEGRYTDVIDVHATT